jgi:hypothetical protein
VITGAHFLLYSRDAEADRLFFRDVLGFRAVDIGHGWLIFAMPPAEAAIHPGSGPLPGNAGQSMLGAELYLMCDDLSAEIESLKTRNVVCSPVAEERWGRRTTVRLPSGGEIGLYQPSHPTALDRA